jgi:hypothetical protein
MHINVILHYYIHINFNAEYNFMINKNIIFE